MGIPYLNNKDFEELILKFSKLTKRHKQYKIVQAQITENFYILVKNIQSSFKFAIDADDCIQEGVLICLTKLHCFDPSKGKAFNYFTTTILNHFRQIYRKQKCFLDFKVKYKNDLMNKNSK